MLAAITRGTDTMRGTDVNSLSDNLKVYAGVVKS